MVPDPTDLNSLDQVTSDILRSLRRIIRSVDINSKAQEHDYGVTAPQLLCLIAILEADNITQIELTARLQMGPSTINGVVDRLEQKGLLKRVRDANDRRRHLLSVTSAGADLVRRAPPPLHQRLVAGLAKLNANERTAIAHHLDQLVNLLAASELDVAPILADGLLTRPEESDET